jgi:hypothetical protein
MSNNDTSGFCHVHADVGVIEAQLVFQLHYNVRNCEERCVQVMKRD